MREVNKKQKFIIQFACVLFCQIPQTCQEQPYYQKKQINSEKQNLSLDETKTSTDQASDRHTTNRHMQQIEPFEQLNIDWLIDWSLLNNDNESRIEMIPDPRVQWLSSSSRWCVPIDVGYTFLWSFVNHHCNRYYEFGIILWHECRTIWRVNRAAKYRSMLADLVSFDWWWLIW